MNIIKLAHRPDAAYLHHFPLFKMNILWREELTSTNMINSPSNVFCPSYLQFDNVNSHEWSPLEEKKSEPTKYIIN